MLQFVWGNVIILVLLSLRDVIMFEQKQLGLSGWQSPVLIWQKSKTLTQNDEVFKEQC